MPGAASDPALRRVILAGVFCVLLSRNTAAQPAPPRDAEVDVPRLVFLVEYIGSDYRNAVRDGVVQDQMEYGEMLRFARQAVDVYAASGRSGDAIAGGLEGLRRSVEARADQGSIRNSVRSLLNLLDKEPHAVA